MHVLCNFFGPTTYNWVDYKGLQVSSVQFVQCERYFSLLPSSSLAQLAVSSIRSVSWSVVACSAHQSQIVVVVVVTQRHLAIDRRTIVRPTDVVSLPDIYPPRTPASRPKTTMRKSVPVRVKVYS